MSTVMLLYVMLYIMLAYLMLFTAVCLYNAYSFIAIDFVFILCPWAMDT